MNSTKVQVKSRGLHDGHQETTLIFVMSFYGRDQVSKRKSKLIDVRKKANRQAGVQEE